MNIVEVAYLAPAQCMFKIPVGGGQFALVDEDDHEELRRYTWGTHDGYATRNFRKPDGRTTTLYMHRHILGLRHGDRRQTDHINRDRLDNRRSNLRIVTFEQNRQNLPSYKGSTSKYRGVSWSKIHGKWRVCVYVNRRQINGGRLYEDEDEAGRAAAAMRAELMPYALN